MEKSNQPPQTEGCLAEGEPVDLWYYRVEQPSRSVPRETREPQAGPASCLSHSASKVPIGPRVAWRKENRWTCGTTESNNRREAYPGKRVSRKRDPHPA